MTETLLVISLREYRSGQIVNVDGQRFRIVKVLRATGTVTRLEIELLHEGEDA